MNNLSNEEKISNCLLFYFTYFMQMFECVDHTHALYLRGQKEGLGFPGTGVTGGYKFLSVGAGNQTGSSCKSSK